MNDNEIKIGSQYLESAKWELERLKSLAEKAFAQISAESHFHTALDKESNSLAVLIRHLSGNMISRWTDFLTTDGEKPSRDRDREFEPGEKMSRDELMDVWNRGWACLFQAVSSLSPEDLRSRVMIRGEEHSVVGALQRQLTHYAYHVGQIVFLAKHLESERWGSLSIPRGQSTNYSRKRGKYLSDKDGRP